jgi:hypothetical protein
LRFFGRSEVLILAEKPLPEIEIIFTFSGHMKRVLLESRFH